MINHQVNDTGDNTNSGFNTENTYNYNFEKEILDKVFALKDGEVQVLKEEK